MFIARQPIFNTSLRVYGYELLFRSGAKSSQFDGTSALKATASVLGGLFESGIDQIVDDKKAFINFDADFIHSEMPELIDSERLVIEVLEDVVVDEALIERIKALKDKGYKIALDDFVEAYDTYPLVPYADIIKFDLMETPLDTIEREVAVALTDHKVLLAEKIETEAEFHKAKKMGFHLFQGYFFSKPNIVGKSSDKTTTKAQYARLITELKKEEPSYQALAEIIEKDVTLAYRVMKIVSTRSGDDLVYSIKRALTYMGLKELERWINILMIRDLSDSKPPELMRLALVRTKFSELVAQNSQLKKVKYEASMMGLFSTIDAMLDQQMGEALDGISLPGSIVEALTHNSGTLAPLYSLLLAYERGDWNESERLAYLIGVDEEHVYEQYKKSLKWAREIIEMMYDSL